MISRTSKSATDDIKSAMNLMSANNDNALQEEPKQRVDVGAEGVDRRRLLPALVLQSELRGLALLLLVEQPVLPQLDLLEVVLDVIVHATTREASPRGGSVCDVRAVLATSEASRRGIRSAL